MSFVIIGVVFGLSSLESRFSLNWQAVVLFSPMLDNAVRASRSMHHFKMRPATVGLHSRTTLVVRQNGSRDSWLVSRSDIAVGCFCCVSNSVSHLPSTQAPHTRTWLSGEMCHARATAACTFICRRSVSCMGAIFRFSLLTRSSTTCALSLCSGEFNSNTRLACVEHNVRRNRHPGSLVSRPSLQC